MQTWLVHMRQPRRLLRDLGVPGFSAFQLIVGGNVLAALVHPLFGRRLRTRRWRTTRLDDGTSRSADPERSTAPMF